jgi:methylated-DNA-[protein]-cysteine S-methyltransferase
MTPFAIQVYKAIMSIPLGEVRSYRWVARRCGKPGACRAVGQVLKRNPLPLVIPCHRVVKSSGELGGYALGAAKKKKLLEMERTFRKCLNRKH